MSVSAILFLIFVFLKPLYLFPSGGLGVGDAVLAAAFLSALIRRLKKGGVDFYTGRITFLCVFSRCIFGEWLVLYFISPQRFHT